MSGARIIPHPAALPADPNAHRGDRADVPGDVDGRWQAYCRARTVAELSGDIADGIEAGRRWRAWLELFERCTA